MRFSSIASNAQKETIIILHSPCSFFKAIWDEVGRFISISFNWNLINIEDSLLRWYQKKEKYKELPFFIFWEVWKIRNRCLFQEIKPFVHVIVAKIIAYLYEWRKEYSHKDKNIFKSPFFFVENIIYGFFDGAQGR